MKKRILLLSLICCLLLSCPAAALTGDAERAADTLVSLHLATGTPDGYHLEEAATLPQAAVLLVRLLGAEADAAAETRWYGLADTPAWANSALNYCAWQGLLRAEEYAPLAALSGEQWSAMLLRAVGISDFTNAANTARRIGLTDRALGESVTRGEMFETAMQALIYPADGGTLIEKLTAKGLCTSAQVNALGLLNKELTARQIADRKKSAVFCLTLYDSKEKLESDEAFSSASAFFIDDNGTAVTNFHSIDHAIHGTGTLITGEVLEIERVLYYSVDYDLAVIRMSDHTVDGTPVRGLNTLELVGKKDARVGDVAYTVGNPLGLGLSLSAGVISAVDHEADLSTLPCIVCDAAISKGSSGGAMMNAFGQVIGVTTGAYANGNSMFLVVPVDPILQEDLSGEGITLFTFVNEVNAQRITEESR